MFSLKRIKPDGRQLWLYSNAPLKSDFDAPYPFAEPLNVNPHLRRYPLRGEWITYATYRQNRTFLPPPEYNPLAVTLNQNFPTELPQGDWRIAVFDNRFPSLELSAHTPPELIIPSQPAIGKCEVVVFTQDANSSLGAQTLAHFELLFKVWAARTLELGQLENIQYILPFENRASEVGVTLNHPHGQIYAYPMVPPVPANMQFNAENYCKENGRSVLEVLIAQELLDGRRIIYRGEHAVAFVPACARYPYEVWVAPIKAVASFADLSDVQRSDLARALKTLLMKFDALRARPFPYLMEWFQAPTDNKSYPESHLHAEFYPPYRTAEKLKFLAGTEIAAGLFAMNCLPEGRALELQAIHVNIDHA